jgi:hypothetical protein
VLIVSVRRVTVAYARGRVSTAAEALELLGTDLVDVDLAEVDLLDRPHRLVQGQSKEVPEDSKGVVGELDDLEV